MTLLDTIDRIVFHPLTVLTAVLGGLASLVQVPLLTTGIEVVWTQAGTVFAATSLSFSQGWLPAGTGQVVVAITATLFLGRLLHKLWMSYERRSES